MHKIIFDLVRKIASSFLSFIAAVWKGATGELLDSISSYVNEVVYNMENIGVFIKQNMTTMSIKEISDAVISKYGYTEIDEEFVQRLINEVNGEVELEFKTAKTNMVFKILKNRFKIEGLKFIDHVVMLSIQLAVTKLNNSKE
jgi:hypothetical protein